MTLKCSLGYLIRIQVEDLIVARGNAIREFRSRLLKRRNLNDLILMVNDVCEAFGDPSAMPDSVVRDVQLAVKKTEGTVLPNNRRLELGVCAVAGVIQSMAYEKTSGHGGSLECS